MLQNHMEGNSGSIILGLVRPLRKGRWYHHRTCQSPLCLLVALRSIAVRSPSAMAPGITKGYGNYVHSEHFNEGTADPRRLAWRETTSHDPPLGHLRRRTIACACSSIATRKQLLFCRHLSPCSSQLHAPVNTVLRERRLFFLLFKWLPASK